MKDTAAFEAEVLERVRETGKILVLCEGETDPKYLEAALVKLGHAKLLEDMSLDWVGQVKDGVSKDGGQNRLWQAVVTIRNNPALAGAGVIAIFDCDAKVAEGLDNRVAVLRIGRSENAVCRSGIENLLPEDVFTDRFYTEVVKHTANVTIIKELKKSSLCDAVCSDPKFTHCFDGFTALVDRRKASVDALRA